MHGAPILTFRLHEEAIQVLTVMVSLVTMSMNVKNLRVTKMSLMRIRFDLCVLVTVASKQVKRPVLKSINQALCMNFIGSYDCKCSDVFDGDKV